MLLARQPVWRSQVETNLLLQLSKLAHESIRLSGEKTSALGRSTLSRGTQRLCSRWRAAESSISTDTVLLLATAMNLLDDDHTANPDV